MSFFSAVSGTLHSQDRFRLSLCIYQDILSLYLNSFLLLYIRLNLRTPATPVRGGHYSHNAALSYTPGGGSAFHGGADDVSQITGGEYGGAIITMPIRM